MRVGSRGSGQLDLEVIWIDNEKIEEKKTFDIKSLSFSVYWETAGKKCALFTVIKSKLQSFFSELTPTLGLSQGRWGGERRDCSSVSIRWSWSLVWPHLFLEENLFPFWPSFSPDDGMLQTYFLNIVASGAHHQKIQVKQNKEKETTLACTNKAKTHSCHISNGLTHFSQSIRYFFSTETDKQIFEGNGMGSLNHQLQSMESNSYCGFPVMHKH